MPDLTPKIDARHELALQLAVDLAKTRLHAGRHDDINIMTSASAVVADAAAFQKFLSSNHAASTVD